MLFGVIGTVINFCCVAPLTYIVNQTYGFTITNKLDIFDKNGKILQGLNDHGNVEGNKEHHHRLLEEVKTIDSIVDTTLDTSKFETEAHILSNSDNKHIEAIGSHSEVASQASSHVDIKINEMFTDTTIYFSTKEILLFASVISATDAVAALAFIKEDSDPKLFPILFGEGVVNDAVCIVLYQIIRGFLDSGKCK